MLKVKNFSHIRLNFCEVRSPENLLLMIDKHRVDIYLILEVTSDKKN